MRREYLPDVELLVESFDRVNGRELKNKIKAQIDYHKSHLARIATMIRANFP